MVTVDSLAGPGQTVETNVLSSRQDGARWGGRGKDANSFGKFIVRASAPDLLNNFTGWIGQVTNQDGANQVFTVFAICASVQCSLRGAARLIQPG